VLSLRRYLTVDLPYSRSTQNRLTDSVTDLPWQAQRTIYVMPRCSPHLLEQIVAASDFSKLIRLKSYACVSSPDLKANSNRNCDVQRTAFANNSILITRKRKPSY
jgi:hypothetical protein